MRLLKDPYNIIITGVGGQGNVTASRILGDMLVSKYFVTIGETFGASQRGGPVMSHIRVSEVSAWSPQIPQRRAHVVAALEPVEAVRVLAVYGNEETLVVCNMRPVYSAEVILGDTRYPPLDEIRRAITDFVGTAWFIDATDAATNLGNPLLSNMVMVGALSGLGVLPLQKDEFEEVIQNRFSRDMVNLNVKAFELGCEMVKRDRV